MLMYAYTWYNFVYKTNFKSYMQATLHFCDLFHKDAP